MSVTNETPDAPPRVPLGGDYWQVDPGTPLWGFADLHAHLMAHLAFGGRAFWGRPYDPEHPGPDGLEHALGSCEPVHGGLININPEFGHPAGGGWPDFIIWPRFTTLSHQQAYLDWLHRAYQGGLRLITCLAVNNELLGEKTAPDRPHDDRSAIETQVAAMKDMVAFVDEQSGGPGKGWLEIACSPEDAQRIIGAGRLAVVLGVEVDALGNWRRPEDIEALAHGDLDRARQMIGLELDRLFELGVRQITPIHLANNAFGGTAIYLRILEPVTRFLSGKGWAVENAWDTGVRYRVDRDGADVPNQVARAAALDGTAGRAMNSRTLLDQIPGVRDLFDGVVASTVPGGHANARGLNDLGTLVLEEMMARGMIIDLDHMSEKSTDAALALAEAAGYPVILSHCWLRDLMYTSDKEFEPEASAGYGTADVHKVASEAGKRGDQVERIGRLGGMVAPILNQGDMAGLRRCLPELADKIAAPCSGSSTAWAQAYLYAVAKMGGRGVAVGSDVNGAAGLPGPRFGTFAAYGSHDDPLRAPARRGEIDRQTNGVAYRGPILDYRWHRFAHTGPGGYDEQEAHIWQAIAQYEAGFDPAADSHPPSDLPDLSLGQILDRVAVRLAAEWIDHVTLGFRLADRKRPAGARTLKRWPAEQRAAYLARRDPDPNGPTGAPERDTRALVAKMRAVWARWKAMAGENPPLVRATAGPRRDYDINLDGMAHYGLLPDLLQDIRNVGLAPADLAPLFRSAFDYVQMWARCHELGEEIAARRRR